MKRDGWLGIGLLSAALLVGAGRAEALLPECSVGMSGGGHIGAAAPAGTALAGTPAPSDGAFLEALAQGGTAQACATSAGLKTTATRASCINLYCQTIWDCSSCPGGLTAWYCATGVHRCVPF